METVSSELIKRIFWHINRTEKQMALLKNQEKWLRLTSALKVLEDTACAIEYYRDTEYPDDLKGRYLFTYGLLQALFVQEDAICSIYVSLFNHKEREFKSYYKGKYPEAYKVRVMRDDVVGHPTDRDEGLKSIHLAQCSMQKESFYYIKWNGKLGTSESISVNVTAAIDEVAKSVNDILDSSVRELDYEFINYIDQYKDKKMKDFFNQLGYAREKVLGDTYSKVEMYQKTKEMVQQCETEIILRFGSNRAFDINLLFDSIYDIYAIIDEGLTRIPPDLSPKIEKCLYENLFKKLEELEEFCERTDLYFENYGEEPREPFCESPVIIIEGKLED